MSRFYASFRPYVPVAQRRQNAGKAAAKLIRRGQVVEPVRPQGRAIAHSFWGQAWCTNLESYSDYANRLPRGRTYLRNGSVVHLSIEAGRIEALVSGSSLYKIAIAIKPFPAAKWKALCAECAGEIGSMLDLLQGKLSARVMAVITRRDTGLFPAPSEINLGCSCPDWADMCKHVAAVLYGVGTRLDAKPELLFTLRSVNEGELIAHAASATRIAPATSTPGVAPLAEAEVSAIFGIEIDPTNPAPAPNAPDIEKPARASAGESVPTPKRKRRSQGRKKEARTPTLPKSRQRVRSRARIMGPKTQRN